MSDNDIKVKINGRQVLCGRDETILDAAKKAGVRIPTLCYDERLEPYGGCRLCIVEVKDVHKPQPACTTRVKDGMEVYTDTDEVRRMRKSVLSLLLSNHPNDCMTCEATGDCALQSLSYEYGVTGKRFAGESWDLPIRDDNPFIIFDPNKCILCGRCVRICNDVVMAGTIEMTGRGFNSLPDTAFGKPRTLDNCEFCGQCVSTCPTGALIDKKGRGKGRSYEMTKVKTTCPYCGTGCNFFLNVRDDKVVKVTSDYDAPVNKGNLCIKGRYGYSFIHSSARLTSPIIKKDGKYVEATWDEAIDLIAKRFGELMEEHGPDSVGAFSSARCTNEENFLLSKFVRTVFKNNNVDCCARV
ncbi:MAG TPA: 2Fe-2S iron-sulfur cluster binding domain-containing protein [Nitrospirae bacterium]|nr:putative formate dehydrogenase [bacterium BMS3Bbin09]HDN94852.1 2Fe-2S iron-sulfur cluster binding domain-containing protein [Nitrospirota bacterium]HDO66660.1 2Fe-2S iron-sulfur cluster binding domain-containing protein [Nitrospirota bacterium]HDZ83633.1 2Fe-2S iron-sulfur cluster binding domain-containing protein [Nitrospirota bacterium]HEW80834.1 2Fe-2S iron-sulfur cluster binding domain-containing protein [Nitrospirota bacterium]